MYKLVGLLQYLNAALANAHIHTNKSKHHEMRAILEKLPIRKIGAGFGTHSDPRLERVVGVDDKLHKG